MANTTHDVNQAEMRLDQLAGDIVVKRASKIGYPVNQKSQLIGFYKWFVGSGMNLTMSNNVGDPFDTEHVHFSLNSLQFEREVIERMGPLYGFDKDEVWGIVTFSGTDGNNHGIYFGMHYLEAKSHQKPVLYVSEEAHYSSRRLADLQGLDFKMIPADESGCMIPEEFEKALDPSKPALVVYAIGTTFKGGVDDMPTLNKILAKYPEMQVYRHLDAALFGGFLPYSEHKDFINRKVNPFDSIAISGHKFFGLDEPSGFFITSREVRNNQNPFKVSYLDCDMPMINCSRSALTPLKLWWILQHNDTESYTRQTALMMENARWFKAELDKIHWPAWLGDMSNTVYFKRPSKEIMSKYDLAPDHDDRLGGDLAHIVVMQHVTKDRLQAVIDDLK